MFEVMPIYLIFLNRLVYHRDKLSLNHRKIKVHIEWAHKKYMAMKELNIKNIVYSNSLGCGEYYLSISWSRFLCFWLCHFLYLGLWVDWWPVHMSEHWVPSCSGQHLLDTFLNHWWLSSKKQPSPCSSLKTSFLNVESILCSCVVQVVSFHSFQS